MHTSELTDSKRGGKKMKLKKSEGMKEKMLERISKKQVTTVQHDKS